MTQEEARKIMTELKAKLARGEITREQFDEARAPVRNAVLEGAGFKIIENRIEWLQR